MDIDISNARWKVVFSNDFKKSYEMLSSFETKMSVLNLLLRLSTGWRPKRKRNIMSPRRDSKNMLKCFKIENSYVICSVDIERDYIYYQILKIWDVLPFHEVQNLISRLDKMFEMCTNDFIQKCQRKSLDGKLEIPVTWYCSDIIRFKHHRSSRPFSDSDECEVNIEYSEVDESLLLMKFYKLTPCIVTQLRSACDILNIDLPFEPSDREAEIINTYRSTFILGRAGTGKTTVMSMKLLKNEQNFSKITEGSFSDGGSLRQIFVTASPCLCYAVGKQIFRLKSVVQGRDFEACNALMDVDCIDHTKMLGDIPNSFVELPIKHFPLVISLEKFLVMLDGTLGSSFFHKYNKLPYSSWKCKLGFVSLEMILATKEVRFQKFCANYWPHFNKLNTKKLEPSQVFTEIVSHIKGGLYSVRCDGKLSREEYLDLPGFRTSILTMKEREKIYDIFLQYESMKQEHGEFDLSDFVIDLHCRFQECKYRGDNIDFVFIDEVQDLTMLQISLFKYICRNVDEGFVFAGDTAQTIAHGVDFRFEDIRCLFYTEFLSKTKQWESIKGKNKCSISPVLHLNQNFRTHDGILKICQSVLDFLYHFFPSSVNILDHEISSLYGDDPVILESGCGENSISTIFDSCGKGAEGFAAELAIIVRDDCCRKNISTYVADRALILTIFESKGLEFQDVILYNFFCSSPLNADKWNVLYNYMNEKGFSNSVCPPFNAVKHSGLCSELKHLYAAVTQTRQRLWICETCDGSKTAEPMFYYWSNFFNVKKRPFDINFWSSVKSCRTEWMSLGMKLFEGQKYERAIVCFKRAGDLHWKKMAEAHHLKHTSEQMYSSDPRNSQKECRRAAEIFLEIDEQECAAKCYFQLNEFEKAGEIYKICGQNAIAGECFHLAGAFDRAAEAYASGHLYTETLHCCNEGKLFNKGFCYIRSWNQQYHNLVIQQEHPFLKDAAFYYYKRRQYKTAMKFAKALHPPEDSFSFIRDSHLHMLFMQLEADRLSRARLPKEASSLILWHIFSDLLWGVGGKGWPPKSFPEMEILLEKAKTIASHTPDHADYINNEVEMLILSTGNCSDIMEKHKGSTRGRVILSRNVVHTLLSSNDHSHLSNYNFSTPLVKSLVFYWSLWVEEVSNVIHSLHRSDVGEFSGEYMEFCLNYLGVEKSQNEEEGGVHIIYTPLYPSACWVKGVYERIKPCFVDPQHLASTANSYWRKEFTSLTRKVMEKLESLYGLSVMESVPLLSQGVLLYNMLYVAKKCAEVNLGVAENHLGSVVRSIFLRVFLLRHEKKDFVISTRESREYTELIQRFILLDIGSGCLTEGQLGRVVVAFFLFTNLPEDVMVTVRRRVEDDGISCRWLSRILEVIAGDYMGDFDAVFSLFNALKIIYNREGSGGRDYVSPCCFFYLIEGLLTLVMASKGYFLTTRSAFFEWFFSPIWQRLITHTFHDTLPMGLAAILDFIYKFVRDMVFDVESVRQWVEKSYGRMSPNGYHELLVQRATAIAFLLTLVSDKYDNLFFEILGSSGRKFGKFDFAEVFVKAGSHDHFNVRLCVVAEALLALKNPLVVVSLGKDCSEMCCGKKAIIVDMCRYVSKEEVLRELYVDKFREDVMDDTPDIGNQELVPFFIDLWELLVDFRSLKCYSDKFVNFSENLKEIQQLCRNLKVVVEKAVRGVEKAGFLYEDNLAEELQEVESVLDIMLREGREEPVSKLLMWKKLVQPVVLRLLRRRTWVEPVLSEPVWKWVCSLSLEGEKEVGFYVRIISYFFSLEHGWHLQLRNTCHCG